MVIQRGYIDIPEGQIHYRTKGNGPPLLLLHQSVCSSDEYSRVIPILAKSYRVIAMDTLGYGESDKPPHPYEITDYARSVVSFLNALSIGKTNVVGHHTGAHIAVELAASYPERVDKLVLSGCPFYRDQNEGLALLHGKVFQPLEIKPDGSHLMQAWEKTLSYSPNAPIELLYELAMEILKAGVRGEEAHWASFRYDPRSRLPLIKSKTLVLSGERDLFYPVVEDVKSLIPQSKIAIIKGRGSTPLIIRRRPEEFAEAVLDFLQNPSV